MIRNELKYFIFLLDCEKENCKYSYNCIHIISFRKLSDTRGDKVAALTEMLHFRATLAANGKVSEACRVRAVWASPVKTYLSMAVRKDAPYAKLLATAQLKSLESGYYHRELGQQMPVGAPSSSPSVSSDEQSCDGEEAGENLLQDLHLGFNRIWFMFLVLAAGAAGAAAMLSLERWVMPVGREDVFSEERRKAFRYLQCVLYATTIAVKLIVVL